MSYTQPLQQKITIGQTVGCPLYGRRARGRQSLTIKLVGIIGTPLRLSVAVLRQVADADGATARLRWESDEALFYVAAFT